MAPDDIVKEVTDSGLARPRRRRLPHRHQVEDGAADAQRRQKYIVCNADEGDSGTFSDRMIMEGDPFVLIEGMTIAGLAVGATKGYIYIRSEYPHAFAQMNARDRDRAREGLPRRSTCSAAASSLRSRSRAGRRRLHLRRGNLAAGKPGRQARPDPFQAAAARHRGPVRQADRRQQRHFARDRAGHPCEKGASHYKDFGMGRSRGTMPIQLAGNIKHGGLVEQAFGLTLARTRSTISAAAPIRAGRSARCRSAVRSAPIAREPASTRRSITRPSRPSGGMVGHGGIVVFDDTVDLAKQARFAMEFCAIESCGKCTPCRIGSTRGVEIIDKIMRGERVIAEHRSRTRSLRHLARRLALRARRADPLPGA